MGHLSKKTIIGIRKQVAPGAFLLPGLTDLIAVSQPGNEAQPITAEDPTLTGSVWTRPPAYLGATASIPFTYSVRGPGPGGLTADNWVFGRVLQAMGFAEIVTAAAITGTAQANADQSAIVLAAGSSAVDDFYLGMPIQHSGLGAATGFKDYAAIYDYDGATKKALIADTATSAIAAGTYTIPPHLLYLLGTGANLPLLSVSVWRDQLRYDYFDCTVASLARAIPVANQQNTELPTLTATLVGREVNQEPVADPAPTPSDTLLLPPPPAKNGKFTFNKARIGHANLGIDFSNETGYQPNQNNFDGQEAAELLSGTRSVTLDINQSDRPATLRALRENQTSIPIASIYGLGVGNRFVDLLPSVVLHPFSPTDRNGFIGLQGNAYQDKVDKSVALAIF